MKWEPRVDHRDGLVCGAAEDGSEPCDSDRFEVVKFNDGRVVLHCTACGETYGLSEVLEVAGVRED